jgi:pyridoxamine 5'-phosphate oxidase
MVLFRAFAKAAFSFFTNYESRKGLELAENPFAAMVFYWAHLGKQVRIEGPTERLSAAESDAYFRQRPLESQITAALSRQSRPLLDEAAFIAEIEAASRAGSIERPTEWGGFKLIPRRYEFWIHRENRRHSRTVFEKEGEKWTEYMLYP